MKKKVFHSCLNFDHEKQYRSTTDKESLTVPDQALTISEIMKRYASGRPINVKSYEEYDGDNIDNVQGIPLAKLDLSEIHDLAEVTRTNLQNLENEKNKRLQEQKDKQLEESIIAKFKARQEAKEQPLEAIPAKFIQTTLPIQETPGK